MLLRLPSEIISSIAEFCPLSTQSSLAQTCLLVHKICNNILYRNDIQQHGSSSVHHAIVECTDQSVAIGTLHAAAKAGSKFQICQEYRKMYPSSLRACHVVLYSPIYLAATRGLDRVVIFLLEHGIPPDGGNGLDITPLFTALLSGEESTAFILARAGAALESETFKLNALHAAARTGLRQLSDYLVKDRGMDVNSKTSSGATPLMLAVSSGEDDMVDHLIHLGANAFEPLLRACHDHQFAYALQILETIGGVREKVLQVQEVVELVMFVASVKTAYNRSPQESLVCRLLRVIQSLSDGQMVQTQHMHCGIAPAHVNELLDGLLQQMLSIDHGDASMALLLIRSGQKIRAGTYIEMLEALRSSTFHQNKPRLLRQHPKLLKCFYAIYSHCSLIEKTERDWLMNWFLGKVPPEAIDLVNAMVRQGFALTARGVETMADSACRSSV